METPKQVIERMEREILDDLIKKPEFRSKIEEKYHSRIDSFYEPIFPGVVLSQLEEKGLITATPVIEYWLFTEKIRKKDYACSITLRGRNYNK